MIFISTAIILCILTVMTASCTFVYTHSDDTRSTRFFAVPVSCSIQAFPAPSLTKPKRETIISWIKKEDFVFEKDEVYKLSSGLNTNLFNSKSVLKNSVSEADLYIPVKSTSYYMRI